MAAELSSPITHGFDGVDVMSQCRRVLVLDRVSDPGNMGTLLRTAVAFGFDAAYLMDGCCDPLNPKALDASKGAPWRLRVSYICAWEHG